MTTTTSYSNAERVLAAYKTDLKKLKGIFMIYGVMAFVFFCMTYMLTLNDALRYSSIYSSYVNEATINIYTPLCIAVFVPLTSLMPLIITGTVFDYIQSKKAVDVYHALPITRTQMLTAHILSGMTVMGTVLAFSFVTVAVTQLFLLGRVVFFGRMAQDFLMIMFVLYCLYIIALFVAVNVGRKRDVRVFAIGIYALPAIIAGVVMALFAQFYYGFAPAFEFIVKLSPVPLIVMQEAMFYMRAEGNSYSLIEIESVVKPLFRSSFIIWSLLAVAITAGAFVIYNKRKSEKAETFNSNDPLPLAFKFGQTFLIAMFMGLIFQAIFGDGYYGYDSYSYRASYFHLYFGAVLGAVLSYLVGEVILSKGFKTIKKALLPCGAITVVSVVFLASLTSPTGFGYVTKVPAVNSVRVAKIDYIGSISAITDVERLDNGYFNRNSVFGSEIALETPQAVERVTALHQDIVDRHIKSGERGSSYITESSSNYYSNSFDFSYTLKPTGSLLRSYSYTRVSAENLVDLEYSQEFQTKTNPLFAAKPSDISSVKYRTLLGEEKTLTLSGNRSELLLEALKKDYLDMSSEKIKQNQDKKAFCVLTVHFGNMIRNEVYRIKSIEVLVEPNFENTIALLTGFPEEIGPGDAEKIEYALVYTNVYGSGSNSPIRQTVSDNSRSYSADFVANTSETVRTLFENGSTNGTFFENISVVRFYDSDTNFLGLLYYEGEEINRLADSGLLTEWFADDVYDYETDGYDYDYDYEYEYDYEYGGYSNMPY